MIYIIKASIRKTSIKNPKGEIIIERERLRSFSNIEIATIHFGIISRKYQATSEVRTIGYKTVATCDLYESESITLNTGKLLKSI